MSNKRRFLYFLAIALSIIYLLWRVFFTIPWRANILTLVFALLLVISEILSNLTGFILIFFRMLSTKKKWNLVIPDYTSTQPLPDVDIIIVTHNEPVELLRKTINAATYIDYPDKSKVHVVVADDGNRPEVQALAKHYHVGYSGMDDNHQAKSGNINHTLAKLHAPLFAIFDTDMIPFRAFSGIPFRCSPKISSNWLTTLTTPNHWVLCKRRKVFTMRIFFSSIYFPKKSFRMNKIFSRVMSTF
ncbi:glycosyltransferase [Lactiplantibacillus pentosus]